MQSRSIRGTVIGSGLQFAFRLGVDDGFTTDSHMTPGQELSASAFCSLCGRTAVSSEGLDEPSLCRRYQLIDLVVEDHGAILNVFVALDGLNCIIQMSCASMDFHLRYFVLSIKNK